MALTYQTPGSFAFSAVASDTSVDIPYPATVSAGDLLVLCFGVKPQTATITTPSGWSTHTNSEATGGAGSQGNDTGQMKIAMFTKVATGSESGNLTVSMGSSPNVAGGFMYRISSGTGNYSIVCVSGSDNSAGASWSVTSGQNLVIASGDKMLNCCAIPTDASSGTWSSESLSCSGATLSFDLSSTPYGETTIGQDMAIRGSPMSCTAGSANATISHSATAPATATNVAGPEVFMRVREAAAATNANAESVAITATSESPTPSVGGSAEGVAITASAENATATTAVVGAAEEVAIVATSNNITVLISTTSESVALLASALDAIVATFVVGSAEEISISATANDATVSVSGDASANAEVATVSASANDLTSKVDINSEVATTLVVAHDSVVATSVSGVAENVVISVVANDSSVSVAPSSESSIVVVSSNDITATIQSNVQNVGIIASALDATVQTGSFVNANAECATVVATSNNSSISTIESGDAENALVSATAEDATISTSIFVNAECATATATAESASVLTEIFANAEVATLVAEVNDVSTLISSSIQVVTVGASAYGASPSTVVPDPDLVITRKTESVLAHRYIDSKIIKTKIDNVIIQDPGG